MNREVGLGSHPLSHSFPVPSSSSYRPHGFCTRKSPRKKKKNTVINFASGKPSNPLRGYSYVHDSKLDSSAKSRPRCTKCCRVVRLNVLSSDVGLTCLGQL